MQDAAMAPIRQCKDDVVSPHMALRIYTYTKAVIGEIPIDEVLITRIGAGGMPVFSSHRIASHRMAATPQQKLPSLAPSHVRVSKQPNHSQLRSEWRTKECEARLGSARHGTARTFSRSGRIRWALAMSDRATPRKVAECVDCRPQRSITIATRMTRKSTASE
jgi:hypothetical protein